VKKLKFERKYWLFVGLAFASLFLYSKTSPLYWTNDWVDPNAFMTVGRGIIHGLVPYRDLFEQKGPLLYFIHALASFTGNNFFGIYLIQSLLLTSSLILFYKLGRLYLPEYLALIVTGLLPFLMLNGSWYEAGDSAEEFAFPAVLSLIYLIFRGNAGWQDYYIQGLLFGSLFWIKYTMIGPWLGFFLFVFFQRQFWKLLLSSLAGFLTISLPILLYFLANGALGDLFEVYFKVNMTAYPRAQGDLLAHFGNALSILGGFLLSQPLLTAIFILGLFGLLLRRNLAILIFLVSFLTTVLAQFYGGIVFPYYLFILIPFVAVGLVGLALPLGMLFTFEGKFVKIVGSLSLALGLLLPLAVNDNLASSRLFVKEAPVTVIFAKIIGRRPNSTLLNYAWLDWGFYLAANKIPNVKYFEYQNISYLLYPEVENGQDSYIASQRTDFVVVLASQLDPGKQALIEQYYQLVAESQGYLLFEKK